MANQINVLELAQGAIQAQISKELGNVLANLMDENTETKAKRKLNVTLNFEVDQNRELVWCTALVKSVLAPVKPVVAKLLVSQNWDDAIAITELHDAGSALAGEIDAELKQVKTE